MVSFRPCCNLQRTLFECRRNCANWQWPHISAHSRGWVHANVLQAGLWRVAAPVVEFHGGIAGCPAHATQQNVVLPGMSFRTTKVADSVLNVFVVWPKTLCSARHFRSYIYLRNVCASVGQALSTSNSKCVHSVGAGVRKLAGWVAMFTHLETPNSTVFWWQCDMSTMAAAWPLL